MLGIRRETPRSRDEKDGRRDEKHGYAARTPHDSGYALSLTLQSHSHAFPNVPSTALRSPNATTPSPSMSAKSADGPLCPNTAST